MTYLEIDLSAVVHNISQILARGYNKSDVFAVVKDDAYGCGAVKVAQQLEKYGISRFVVARMSEAMELRDARIRGTILVLGECTRKELEYASNSNIHVAVNSVDSLQNMVTSNLDLSVHVNVDTGMGRLGVLKKEINEVCRIIKLSDNIVLEAVYTHFACADDSLSQLTALQKTRFDEVKSLFVKNDLAPNYYHMPNSAGASSLSIETNTLCRLGIILYGCKPDPKVEFELDLKNVMSLKSRISIIKRISSGDTVSYGANFVAEKETVIATVAAGYAHGIPRLLTGQMEVLIRGKKYPVVGNVTMDYVMVDIGTDSGIDAGEEVVIMGCQNGNSITADEIAVKCNTIGYEILCSMGRNREKRYLGR